MGRKSKILIAEDDPEVLESIEYILELHNFRVVGKSGDGMDVIMKFFELKPDLVILDIAMPRMNGLDVIMNIMKDDAKAKILVVSALYHPNVQKASLKAGAKEFLLKPFEIMELINAVERILGIKKELT